MFWVAPLALVVLGGLVSLASYLPFLNRPQCPAYATRMPDGSACIIGANIGVGLIWLLGIALAALGGASLVVSLLVTFGRRAMAIRHKVSAP